MVAQGRPKEIHTNKRAKRTELMLKSEGNTNAVWKIINNCLPKKSRNRPFITENPAPLANKFNEYFTSVPGSVTAQKARGLAIEHNFDIHPASSANLCSVVRNVSVSFGDR